MNENETPEPLPELETLRDAALELKPETRQRLVGAIANADIPNSPAQNLLKTLLPALGVLAVSVLWFLLKDLRDGNGIYALKLSKWQTLLLVASVGVGATLYAYSARQSRAESLPWYVYLLPFLGIAGTLPFHHALMGDGMAIGRGWLMGGAVGLLCLCGARSRAGLFGLMATALGLLTLFESAPQQTALGVALGWLVVSSLFRLLPLRLPLSLPGERKGSFTSLPTTAYPHHYHHYQGLFPLVAFLLATSPLLRMSAVAVTAFGALGGLLWERVPAARRMSVATGATLGVGVLVLPLLWMAGYRDTTFFIAAIVGGMATGYVAQRLDRAETEETPSVLGVLLTLCSVVVANLFLPRFGGGLAVVGMALVAPQRIWALLPFAALIALFRLLPQGSRTSTLTDHYALMGIIVGAAVPGAVATLHARIPHRGVAMGLLYGSVALVPFTLTLLFGAKCLLALHIGLALGVAYAATRSRERNTIALWVALGIAFVGITFGATWVDWVSEFTRADRLKWLVGIALTIMGLFVYTERKPAR